MSGLDDALARLAALPSVLVASDFDGVLAPIVTRPGDARALPGTVEVLRELAALPGTEVALVSGRSLAGLAAVAQVPPEIRLVGGHGSEFDGDVELQLDPAAGELHARIAAELKRLLVGYDGVHLEVKPASIAVHTRTASRPDAAATMAAVRSGPAGWPGVRVTEGKEVIELSVVDTDKGTAVTTLRTRYGADGVLYLGDDVTDEHAFAALAGTDVGVKVGPGETRAGFRVPDPPAVLAMLREFLRLRRSRSTA